MSEEKVRDITLEVLIGIRDEIKALRADTNKRFEQMDRRFERIEKDISQIRQGIDQIVVRFDRDFLVLATDVGAVKKRLEVCETRLGIASNQ